MHRRVMVFGTFDGLHEGHRDLFAQAKRHGDTLIVIVARDTTVEKVKGRKPRAEENERLAAVKMDASVSDAYLGNTGEVYQVITDHKPDTICLGYDQQAFTAELADWLVKQYRSIPIIRLTAFHPDKYKSSLLRERAKQANK